MPLIYQINFPRLFSAEWHSDLNLSLYNTVLDIKHDRVSPLERLPFLHLTMPRRKLRILLLPTRPDTRKVDVCCSAGNRYISDSVRVVNQILARLRLSRLAQILESREPTVNLTLLTCHPLWALLFFRSSWLEECKYKGVEDTFWKCQKLADFEVSVDIAGQ